MKRITFNNPTAQKIYDDYFKRVRRCVSILPESDQLEMIMELNSHIYEATQGAAPANEVEVLVNTIENLGMPEEVLAPAVADKKVKQATRSFNPKHIFQALYLNIFNGVGYVLFALVYLLIISFGFLILFKLIYPAHTGFFTGSGHVFFFGFMAEIPVGVKEQLGNWFFITDITLMAVLYFLNTLLFRLLKGK